jgi:hypothetical protein
MKINKPKIPLRKSIVGWGGVIALTYASADLSAQSLTSSAQFLPSGTDGCAVLAVNFDPTLIYIADNGTEGSSKLSITLKHAGTDGESLIAARRILIEKIAPPINNEIAVTSISLNWGRADPVLEMVFDRPVSANMIDTTHNGRVLIQLNDSGTLSGCDTLSSEDIEAFVGEAAANALVIFPDTDNEGDFDPLTPEEQSDLDETIAKAREAITAQNYPVAIRQVTKILSFPENSHSADAQELLGVVRERNGQIAHAKAEYELYLEKYPGGEGAVRVGQRLAAIKTAEAAPPKPLREISGSAARVINQPADELETNFRTIRTERPNSGLVVFDSSRGRSGRRGGDEEEFPRTEFWGSVDTFYFFNQGSTRLTEFDTSRTTVDDFIFENSLVTSLDLFWSRETKESKLSFFIVATNDTDFIGGTSQDPQISRLYARYVQKGPGLTFTFGRQSINRNGVFGRFDGGHLAWQAKPNITVGFQIGSPVDSVRDPLFEFDRLMYGVSVDFEDALPNVDVSVYAIQQNVGSLTDRQAIGGEVEYQNDTDRVVASLDYDLAFDKFNFARISGTRIFKDKSTLTLGVDLVQSPYLALTNALQGQTANSINALRALFTPAEIRKLAEDRTTASASVTVAYSRPLSQNWNATVDGTLFRAEGNPASGGVPAIASPGYDYFASLGVFGTNVFRESDVISTTLRFADTSTSTLYLTDAYYRFKATKKLRIRPRVKLGHRSFKSGGNEIFSEPSITIDYKLTKQAKVELEVGERFSRIKRPGSKERSKEVYVFAGIRYEF